MKSTVAKRSDTEVTLTITMDGLALAPIVTQTYNKLRAGVKVAGFRPGKAPDFIVERELGANAVQQEVLEHATSHAYAGAVREHDLPVIASPQVSLTKFVPYDELEFTATAELLPKVTLADYKKLKLKRLEVKVEDDEIDRVVEDLRKRVAKRAPAERPAQIGDEVTIDFAGSKDGQPVTGATATSYPLLLGSGSFIPGFEEQLVGLKAGEAKTFDIKFPKDYDQPELAGQTVTFAVTVHKLAEVKLPVADDQFASDVGPFKTMTELRHSIRQTTLDEKREAAERDFETAALDQLIKGSKLSLPGRLVEEQIRRLRGELSERLSGQGMDLEKYAKLRNQSPEQLDNELKPEAERRVKLAIILHDVAKTESLTVTPTEVADELKRLKAAYPDPEMQKELSRPETSEEIYNHLLSTRTIAKILSYTESETTT